MKETIDARNERCRKVRMLERRDTRKEEAEKEVDRR